MYGFIFFPCVESSTLRLSYHNKFLNEMARNCAAPLTILVQHDGVEGEVFVEEICDTPLMSVFSAIAARIPPIR
jgi:hypothetical protein